MATWKVKGVVPDSDDEEELDSQSVLGYIERPSGDGGKFPPGPENCVGQHLEWLQEYNYAISPSRDAATKANIGSYTSSIHSSPRRFFKDPRTLLDLDSANGDQGLQKTTDPQPIPDFLREEEISTSYARITSPMSSSLSSLSENQFGSSAPELLESTRSSGTELVQTSMPISETSEAKLPVFERPVDYSRRTFRQRNAIQLHPYIVEQERYRQTLKARGMTPMRLAQTVEEHSKRSRHISEELESQEFETQKSQPMDIDSSSVPPSSAQSTVQEIGGDDEFPDIDEILRDRQSFPLQSGSRRRLMQYSSKSKQRQPLEPNRQPTQRTRRIRDDSIFNVPASPPQTSSPLPDMTRGTQPLASRILSHSPSTIEEDELAPEKIRDLPTPATSVVKPVSDPILIDLASDEDDPFATEPSVSCSSSDESVEIRKIKKKIRGVLPASHLRLDQHLKRPKPTNSAQRDIPRAASANENSRRGVALPKTNRGSRTPSPTASRGMPVFSDDSDEGDEELAPSGLIMEDDDIMMSDVFSQQRLGFAEEDDRIDAMLPSNRRQDVFQGTHPRKRQRTGGASLHKYRELKRQVKITDHLLASRNPGPSKRYKIRRPKEASRHTRDITSRPHLRLTPPRLGILDVIDVDGSDRRVLPRFIRVAARAAKSKRDYGRQSPTNKFIRLASRDDTYDAQSVLQDWKAGKIEPRDLGYVSRGNPAVSRPPLDPISDNHQTRHHLVANSRPNIMRATREHIRQPRKLVISQAKQSSLHDFVISKPILHEPSRHAELGSLPVVRKRQEKHQFSAPKLRPAQLESSEAEYSHQYPSTAFRSRKKVLDNLYKTARKQQAPQSNIQLTRFLANEGSGSAVDIVVLPKAGEFASNASVPAIRFPRSRKRPPNHIDVGAAVYRQPSEPLVLESLPPGENLTGRNEWSSLQGLGKFGTRYTSHFDVFPLPSGVFFHETTFIGSGRLVEVLQRPPHLSQESVRSSISYHIGEKTFQWGAWNEDVSSELGVCFDLILDQLNQPSSQATVPYLRDDIVGIATFVVNYVQHHLSFADLQQQHIFFSRIMAILNDALTRLELTSDVREESQLQSRIEVTSMWAVLVLQLLQTSRSQASQSSVTAKLEQLLISTTRHCVNLLLRKGLESVRKVYDDLQYLSFRANGIKKDQYVVHSWVMVIKILSAARIPRGSFWDIANTVLIDTNLITLNDARSMEKTWYSIFTLLPLCEFDESGVIISGQRQNASFDNWFLPQKMLKSVFTFYSSGSRQSPSFNDYCRAIVRRCHYLIVEWGWWKCYGVIGVLFDFFASQNLGHLRNEEVYKSPQFLEELDREPSLAIEPDDRCFHVFLKIIALAIKHMREANEGKSIRNLVFRLLPNHDRQYPKEETLDTRDLASLRNHHDLLCTLYWAAPSDYRPSLSLIQELVIADRSHNAACLINLRAWQQLSRFVFTQYTSSEAFQPLLVWQNTFWAQLLNQFLEEDGNTRKQAALLSSELITESRLQDTIVKNKTSTMALLRSTINSIGSAMLSASTSDAAMAAFNTRKSCAASR